MLILQGILVSGIAFGLKEVERRVLIKSIVVSVKQPTNLSVYIKIKNIEELLQDRIGKPYISLNREELITTIKNSSDAIRNVEIDSSLEHTLVGTLKIDIDAATAEAIVLHKKDLWFASESGEVITKVKGGIVQPTTPELDRLPMIWADSQQNSAMRRMIQGRSLIQSAIGDLSGTPNDPGIEVEEVHLSKATHPEFRVLLRLEKGSSARVLCRFLDSETSGLQSELGRLRSVLKYILKSQVYPKELDFRFGRRVIARSK